MSPLKSRLIGLLRWSERYTKTDMVYLASSGFWVNLGSITVSLFSFALYLAFAHFLPKEVYGTYQYLLSLATIVGAFTLTGMNSALTRAVAQGKEGTVSASILLQLRFGLLPLVGSFAAGGYYLIHGNIVLGIGLILIGIFVPLNNALNSFSAWVGGRRDFKAAFFFNLFSNLLFYPALIIAAFYSDLALIILAANLLSQTVALAVSYRVAVKRYRPNLEVDATAFSYGGHLTVMGVFGTIAGQIDSILAFHLLGASPLAVYSFATAIPDRLANLVKSVPAIAMPKFALRTREEVRGTLVPRLLFAIAGASVITLLYIVFTHFFFSIFFSPYMAAVPYSMLYALGIIPTVGTIFATLLTAQRSIRALYIFNGLIPIFQIGLMAVGVLWWGLWGLVIARLLTYVIHFVVGAVLFFFYDEPDTLTA